MYDPVVCTIVESGPGSTLTVTLGVGNCSGRRILPIVCALFFMSKLRLIWFSFAIFSALR